MCQSQLFPKVKEHTFLIIFSINPPHHNYYKFTLIIQTKANVYVLNSAAATAETSKWKHFFKSPIFSVHDTAKYCCLN